VLRLSHKTKRNMEIGIHSVQALNDKLSEPSEALIRDMEKINGDILILGIGGKMGPSLAHIAVKARKEGGKKGKIIGVSRFSEESTRQEIEQWGIETISGDLLNDEFLFNLPEAENIIYMAGNKFGTAGNEHYTWAMNAYLPGRVAQKFKNSRIVVFSSGNIYPFVSIESGGATEMTYPGPVGEYAQSCLGRERVFDYFSHLNGTQMLFFRLNYALDLRYGVLREIAKAVWEGHPIDLTMGYVNVIWQGDAIEYALRSLLHCQSPAYILNVTGPEILSVKWLAEQFGQLMSKTPKFINSPEPNALLNNAGNSFELFGKPKISLEQMIAWTVDWLKSGGEELGKATHFQERKGIF